MAKPHANDVLFQLERVVFSLGDVKDPISGKYVSADQYREEMEEIARAYGQEELNFDYEKAAERGAQSGIRDFSDHVTYYKWHVFRQSKQDKYGLSG